MRYDFGLYNKDLLVMEFSITIEGVSESYQSETVYREDLIPRDMESFKEWLESRYIMLYQREVKSFFKVLGVESLPDFIIITNCVSLRDTYWVKEKGSNRDWNLVSPYRNPLNKAIADYAMGSEIGVKKIVGSPDFSTYGTFPKCWRREGNILYLYKAGTSGAANAGLEPYCEVYANMVAQVLGVNCVRYEMSAYKGIPVSKCECITSEERGLLSLKDYLRDSAADYTHLLDSLEGADKDRLIDMLMLDYVTCNIDRHYGNISYFIDNDTNELLGLADAYDHNLSCLPYYDPKLFEETLEEYVDTLRAKDGSTFNELFDLIDSRKVRSKLSMLKGRTFSLDYKHDEVVNSLIRVQLSKIK